MTNYTTRTIGRVRFRIASEYDEAEERTYHYANCVCGEQHCNTSMAALVSLLVRCVKRRNDR